MSNNAQKISNVNITTTLSSSDRVVVVSNANTTANVNTITLANLANSMPAVAITNTFPSNSTSVGYKGQIAFDSSFIYVCVAANTWMRSALSSF